MSEVINYHKLGVCSNCDNEKLIVALGECWACYQYRRRHNEARPFVKNGNTERSARRKVEMQRRGCCVCGETDTSRFIGDRCSGCYQYYKRVGKDRVITPKSAKSRTNPTDSVLAESDFLITRIRKIVG